MKKRCVKFALPVLTVLLVSQPAFAITHVNDPSYSQIDGVTYSDVSLNCSDLHNSEECEIFRAAESYSLRDGLSYADCSVDCDDLFATESCFVFRQSHPCEERMLPKTVAAID